LCGLGVLTITTPVNVIDGDREADVRRTSRALADGACAPPRDTGSTFAEVLIAIVLIGTVLLGLLTATRAQVIASRTSREAARVQSALLVAADRVERAPIGCDFSGPVEAAAQLSLGVSELEAPSYAQLRYEYLTATGWEDGACPGDVHQPNLVQRIGITMISPDTGLARTLEVVKGDV
jgi:hypothetical protein